MLSLNCNSRRKPVNRIVATRMVGIVVSSFLQSVVTMGWAQSQTWMPPARSDCTTTTKKSKKSKKADAAAPDDSASIRYCLQQEVVKEEQDRRRCFRRFGGSCGRRGTAKKSKKSKKADAASSDAAAAPAADTLRARRRQRRRRRTPLHPTTVGRLRRRDRPRSHRSKSKKADAASSRCGSALPLRTQRRHEARLAEEQEGRHLERRHPLPNPVPPVVPWLHRRPMRRPASQAVDRSKRSRGEQHGAGLCSRQESIDQTGRHQPLPPTRKSPRRSPPARCGSTSTARSTTRADVGTAKRRAESL